MMMMMMMMTVLLRIASHLRHRLHVFVTNERDKINETEEHLLDEITQQGHFEHVDVTRSVCILCSAAASQKTHKDD